MSQSQAPTTDTQAVLQSMLQRLRLQPGIETHRRLHHFRPATTAPHHEQGGGTGTPYVQTVGGLNNIPVDGLGAGVVGPSHTDDITTEPGEQGGRGLGNHGNSGKGCEVRKWDSREEFGILAWDGDYGKPATSLTSREGHQLVQLDQGQEVTTFSSSLGVISSPSCKNNIVSDRVENRGSGQASLPVITPTGSGQRFPADTLKDADVTSFERRDEIQGEGEGYGNSATVECIDSENLSTKSAVLNPHDDQSSLPDTSPLTSQSPYQNSRTTTEGTVDSRTVEQSQNDSSSDSLVQGLSPRVYAWSLKPPEAIQGTGSDAKSTPLQGNGGFGVLSHSKDTEILSTGQKTANSITSGVHLKKRLAETKTRRWTQRIKDRWRERHGSSGKKGKEEGEMKEVKDERKDEFSPQNQPSVAQNVIELSNKEGERTLHSTTRSDLMDTPPDLSQHSTTDGHTRSVNDFEFGLGSFSLLEEILTGQEWARFLNPTLTDNTNNQRSAEQPTSQLKTTLNLRDQGVIQSAVNQSGSVTQWNVRGTESDRVSDFSMTPMSTDVSVPIIMDISEPNHVPEQDSRSKATHLQPMEHRHIQSDTTSEESVMGLSHTPQADYSFIKPVEVLDNSAMKSRAQLNRKRVHQSQEGRREEDPAEEGERDKKEAKIDESKSSLDAAISQTMDESDRKEDDNAMMSLYPTKSSLSPLSPSSTPPSVPVLRSVLRHSMSQDSESSVTMETLTKKRRVEDARQVRFSEEIVTIAPIDLDLEGSDTEEDSGTEEDSVIEQDVGMEQAVEEVVVVPAPRSTLPAWILALKRRKTRRKPRQ